MDRCGFIIHPHSWAFLERYLRSQSPNYRPRKKELMRKLLEWTPVHQSGKAVRIESITGEAVEVVFINCSLMPEQWVSLPEEFTLERVLDACRLAVSLGARLIGLSAFTSIVGDQGTEVAAQLDVPVTSGNTFTVHTVVSDVRRAAAALDLDLAHATVAVLGATGDIGSGCLRILARDAGRLVLCARTAPKLEEIADELREISSAELVLVPRAGDAIRNVDVVISATSAISSVIDNAQLKPGAIVCDVGFPRHISTQLVRERPDVLAFEGGLVCAPHPVDFGFETGFPSGTLAACLSETALLTLSKRFESFSIGRGKIKPEKVTDIAKVAEDHGFVLDRFRCGDYLYEERDLERVRTAASGAVQHATGQ